MTDDCGAGSPVSARSDGARSDGARSDGAGSPVSARSDGAGSDGARSDGLWADRVGVRCYTGHNARGATVRIGPEDAGDMFTPGELLKLALAGCAGMSADAGLRHRFGDDVDVTVHVAGTKHPTDEHYLELREEMVVDLAGLDPAEQERLITVVHRAIDRTCTVGRTLERGARVALTVTDASAGAGADADANPRPRSAQG